MCNPKNHDLVIICRIMENYEIERVVRWCKNCGCIVGDVDIDNRIYPGRWFTMITPGNTGVFRPSEKEFIKK